MTSITRTRAVTVLVTGSALILAAPAGAESTRGKAVPAASTGAESGGKLVLRRDGSRAVPFRIYPTPGRPVLRRDGSQALPFAAYPDQPALSPAEPGGFDWGDVAIAAAGALALTLSASGGLALARRRRQRDVEPTVPA